MSLINCDECGHRISDKSIFCPSCGYPTHLNKALRDKAAHSETSGKEQEPKTPLFEQFPEGTTMPSGNCPIPSTPSAPAADGKGQQAAVSETKPDASIPATADTNASEESKVKDAPVSEKHPKAETKADAKETVREETKTETKEEAKAEEQIIADVEARTEVPSALEEYEASLGRELTPARNNRMKLVLYFAVLVILLIAVALCYYYAKSSHLGSVDEVECEPIEEVWTSEPQDASLAKDSADISQGTNPGTDSIAPRDTLPPVDASPAVRQL